jgi:hypothetical protein
VLVRQLIEDQQEARFKPWELPVNQFNGLQIDLPQLVPQLTFNSVQGLRRLHRSPQEGPARLSADHRRHVDRHG